MSWYLVIFILYFAFIAWACLRSLRNVESMSDFTTGGHRMGLWIGVGTSAATWLSVASVMGVPGYLYSTGVAAIIGWVAGWFFATALIPLVAYKIRRPRVPARTFPEFVQMRYEPKQRRSNIRVLVAALMVVGYFIFVHLQVVGFGIVVSTITGVDYRIAIFGFLAFLLFTSLGGFWSVAVTDTVNTVLILGGVILGAITVLNAAGGWENIMTTLETTTAPVVEGGEELPAGVMLTPLGTFSLGALMAIFLSNALGAAIAPHWVGRMLAPKNAKTAVMQMMISLGVLILIFVPLIIIGLGAKTLVPSLPEGQSTDYILPFVIESYTHPLIGALTLIALAAAAVSTANSMLLHCGTSLYYDILQTLRPEHRPDEVTSRRRLRWVVLGLGVVAVLSAINPPVLLAMGFTYVYGGFGAVFFFVVFLGLYWKRMNRAGAYANIILGAGTYAVAEAVGAPSPFLIAFITALVGVLVAVKLTPAPPAEAVEPYFQEEVSTDTAQIIAQVRGDAAPTAGAASDDDEGRGRRVTSGGGPAA